MKLSCHISGEDIAGPYVWGNYDILLLPPSFPYGGKFLTRLFMRQLILSSIDGSLHTQIAMYSAHYTH